VEVDFLRTQEVLRSEFFGIERKAKSVRYPVRMLRYWFGYHLLTAECRRVGRPLDVVELGTHNGQMLVFANVAAKMVRDPMQRLRWSSWLGVDAMLKRDVLATAGYDELQEGNVDDDAFLFANECDAAVCLHVFEHTTDPEGALHRVAARVRPGGAVIGGSPVLPHPLVGLRERQLRASAAPFGHVSAFSPQRVAQLVGSAGLKLEFFSGAFFMRHKGFALENSRRWLRLNLWWGRMFPWWPGEIYWAGAETRRSMRVGKRTPDSPSNTTWERAASPTALQQRTSNATQASSRARLFSGLPSDCRRRA
jgi:SAM-dependent methyltransferase